MGFCHHSQLLLIAAGHKHFGPNCEKSGRKSRSDAARSTGNQHAGAWYIHHKTS